MELHLAKSPSVYRPNISFGPFRLLEAVPWLIVATTMRVLAYGGGIVAFPALVIASIAILHAFVLVARQSIELSGGQTELGTLPFREQFRFCRAILWRVVIVIGGTTLAFAILGWRNAGQFLVTGLDGMAFDQFTDLGRFWSAAIATLVLLMIVNAEGNGGKISLPAALSEFRKRWLWLLAAILVLGIANVCLSAVQGGVRGLIWNYWQSSDDAQWAKNYVYFAFIFAFATARLWLTLLILTYGLKQSYIREQSQSAD